MQTGRSWPHPAIGGTGNRSLFCGFRSSKLEQIRMYIFTHEWFSMWNYLGDNEKLLLLNKYSCGWWGCLKVLLKSIESWVEIWRMSWEGNRNAWTAVCTSGGRFENAPLRSVTPPHCTATVHLRLLLSLAAWPGGSLCTLRTSSCACRMERNDRD